MFLRLATSGMALLGVLALESFVGGDEPPTADPVAQDKQVVDSKVVHGQSAAAVKFRKQLNLPFNSLNSLGSRIDTARRAHDPVALAHAANELHVAEQVSGKTASITSNQLIQESAELAALKRQEAELQAVARVADQVAAQGQVVAILKKNIALAQEQARADKAASAMNEEPTWKPRSVIVNNYGTDYIDVYINGNFKVTVAPGMQQTCIIEHRWNPTVLTAFGNEDIDKWGPRYIWGRWDKYTWNIR